MKKSAKKSCEDEDILEVDTKVLMQICGIGILFFVVWKYLDWWVALAFSFAMIVVALIVLQYRSK